MDDQQAPAAPQPPTEGGVQPTVPSAEPPQEPVPPVGSEPSGVVTPSELPADDQPAAPEAEPDVGGGDSPQPGV